MTEPSPDELQPGAVLQQRYEIVRRIGAGGFGEVYLAKHRKFRQRVAVKKLRAAVASEAMREQFEKEAALLFGLSHRGLPKVVDAFSQEDGEFLVMEYVEGKDLAEVLQEQRGPVDLARVLAWADQILDALEYIHTRRPPVIHRDIKPQNVKLCSDGRVVLLDFGLAKGASGLM
jgi:serine/threonine protein kinase